MSCHVGFLTQYGVNRKMDRPYVSGMLILSGVDTMFGYLALLEPKLYMYENSVSGGHFGFYAPVTLCHGFSKSTSWTVERLDM